MNHKNYAISSKNLSNIITAEIVKKWTEFLKRGVVFVRKLTGHDLPKGSDES